MNTNPFVSVLMPVYNAEAYLKLAIESIINQTYKNFELILVNDGSTDKSEMIIQDFKDPRVILINNPENKGLIATLNHGISICKGTYILRMDADDISSLDRIEKQVAFMEEHLNVGVLGGYMKDLGNGSSAVHKFYTDHESIKCNLLFNSALAHPTVIFRKNIIDNLSLVYSQEYKDAEDYELWERLSSVTTFSNLPEVILQYRIHANQVSQSKSASQMASADKVRLRVLAKLKIEPSKDEILIHRQISTGGSIQNLEQLNLLELWLLKILEANEEVNYFNQIVLSRLLASIWLSNATNNKFGIAGIQKYMASNIFTTYSKDQKSKFLIKAIGRTLWKSL